VDQHSNARTMSPSQSDHEDVLRIMVIDDSKTIRRSAESLLRREGWDVVTAVDGFDALAKVVEHKPDIVFADIMMPRLDGYQTCALIKNNADYRHIPVVMLSSKDGLFDRARGRVVGADAHLAKPFAADDIIETTEALLRPHSAKLKAQQDKVQESRGAQDDRG